MATKYMSKKKSLGHNPLGYSLLNHSSLDFIPDYKEKDKSDLPYYFEPVKKINKVTVSYYLEEPLVKKVRRIAEQKGTSYSAIISQLLNKSLMVEK